MKVVDKDGKNEKSFTYVHEKSQLTIANANFEHELYSSSLFLEQEKL